MKFQDFESVFRDYPLFTIETVATVTEMKRTVLRTTLSRWVKSGRLIPLRRGVFTLATTTNLPATVIANEIYRPSYLSLDWALSYYGLIPEAIHLHTSVTPRVGKVFRNRFGQFKYHHLKTEAFWGYEQIQISGWFIIVALPEKALLDFWYFRAGEWTSERMEATRFQQTEIINVNRLVNFTKRWNSPRLNQAADAFLKFQELPV